MLIILRLLSEKKMSPRNIRINQLVDFLAHHLEEKSTEFECSKCGSEVKNDLLGNLKHLLFDNFLHSPLREHTFLFKAYKIVIQKVISLAPLEEGNMIFREGYQKQYSNFDWVDTFTVKDINDLQCFIQKQSNGNFVCPTCRKLVKLCNIQ